MAMIPMKIDVSKAVKEFSKTMKNAQSQIPFTVSLAINKVAQLVKFAELENIQQKFDRPTPFTMQGVGITTATKNNLQATIFVKDKQQVYLTPYETGGSSIPAKPGNVAMLTPKGIKLNQYGNIPYKKIKTLLGTELDNPVAKLSPRQLQRLMKNRKKYFIGTINTKGGEISGLWERTSVTKSKASAIKFNSAKKTFAAAGQLRGLKLLVRFTDPEPVKIHLGYQLRAQQIVDRNFTNELSKAMEVALRTARK
jgi:hypothetical protein